MILRITNTPRPYAWGSVTAIADLLGRPATGAPEAELWLGSHPGSPARIVEGASESELAEWAAAHLEGGRLPFLFKVLAAASPLSLQVHPTADQARAGFERENAAGIALDARERNYRDPYPKPELIVAVSDPFLALCGFRPVNESVEALSTVSDPRITPLVARLSAGADLGAAVSWLLSGGSEADDVIAALTDWANAAPASDIGPGSWLGTVRMLAQHYPGDPGIAISTLLHTVRLRPGEALYLPAGNLHAYLEGLGYELMAASDNVIRGGLTEKHIDAAELLAVLDTTARPVPELLPERLEPGVMRYSPPRADFRLTAVDGEAAHGVEVPIDQLAIVLCVGGSVVIEGQILDRGEAALVQASSVHVSGTGRAVIATGK